MERRQTINFDGTSIKVVIPSGEEEDEDAVLDGAEDVQLPVSSGEGKSNAILPNVLRNLVQKRKLVKD